ncbi:unnamed protein product [Mytilus coruscus]|uniref:Uncharacterized protein n=1 Tax=Mytilus coruscus TaxID=42192 RepID=A0A6J8DUM0_MYTCO|nr:unnamed protein product [Mytilus coruscus]
MCEMSNKSINEDNVHVLVEPQSTTLEYVSISELGDTSSVDNISELKGRSIFENVTKVVSSCIVAFLLFQTQRRYIAALKTQRSVSGIREVDNSRDRANTNGNTNESSHDTVHQPNSLSFAQTINREQLQVDRTTENLQEELPDGVASDTANQYEQFNDRRQNVQHIYDECEIKIDASATELRRREDDSPIYDECGNVYEALITEHSENNEVNDHMYL